MSEIIAKICYIPHDLRVNSNKSVVQLLRESGYFHDPDIMTIRTLIDFLEHHKNIINDWEIYSSDKRTDSGWYLLVEKNGAIVGYFEKNKQPEEQYFSSVIEACAVFINHEICSIAVHAG